MTVRARRAVTVVAAVAGMAMVVALVVSPVRAALATRDDLEQKDLAAVEGFVVERAPAGAIGSAPLDLFTIRRAPTALVGPVRDRRAIDAFGDLGLDYPEPACLTIRMDGEVVQESGTTDVLIPASVQKLLTAVAVVDLIGADERFTTRVLSTAPMIDGAIAGNLVMVGGGDPMLGTKPYADAYSRQPQLRTSLEELADNIAATGLRRVRGRIIVNDDRYDRIRVVPTWPARYLTQFNAGPIGALTMNDGFAQWQPARVYADDPAIYAGEVLATELLRRGVRVDGGSRRGEIPANAELLASIESPPMRLIVQQMLRESDNNTAESLLKELGYRATGDGTTEAGAIAVKAAAEARGLDVSGLVVMDGSGLDRGNLVTCGVLASILETEGPDSVIGAGLAVAGETGTIGHRFGSTNAAGRLHAKTGLLNNVNGLAGWIQSPDGAIITFAQLLNGIPLDSRLGFSLQEELAIHLAGIEIAIDPDDLPAVDSD